MPDNQSNGKGNPARKRAANPKNKSRRATSWAAGQKRKAARREQLAQQRGQNMLTLAAAEAWRPGITPGPKPTTPWQAAKEKRRQRRIAEGYPQRWAAAQRAPRKGAKAAA